MNWGGASICGDAGDVLAEDEGMNVVRAFVGLYGFEVHHVAHDGVVLRNSICDEDKSL